MRTANTVRFSLLYIIMYINNKGFGETLGRV